jgi:PKHD-type hydroxylase
VTPPGTTGAQARALKHNPPLAAGSAAERELQTLVLGALERSSAFLAAALPRRVLPPRINRYTPEHPQYGEHVDQAVRYHAGEPVRTDIAVTLFLSDPAGYDGGELAIQHSFGEQRVKLAAGSAVLYPASSVHRVTPVTRGERLAAFFWVQSLVSDAEQRRLLHTLDTQLGALRARHGDSAETVALMGCYHNLLRQWSRP